MTIPDASLAQRLLFQHAVLRVLLGRLSDAAKRTVKDESAVQDLRDAQRTLQTVLEAHARNEEAVFGPLLECAGDTARLEWVRGGHQRVLTALRAAAALPPRRFAASATRLALLLLSSLAAEERAFLDHLARPSSGDESAFTRTSRTPVRGRHSLRDSTLARPLDRATRTAR
jgi:Hemerythrin HHE cation binding domain